MLLKGCNLALTDKCRKYLNNQVNLIKNKKKYRLLFPFLYIELHADSRLNFVTMVQKI